MSQHKFLQYEKAEIHFTYSFLLHFDSLDNNWAEWLKSRKWRKTNLEVRNPLSADGLAPTLRLRHRLDGGSAEGTTFTHIDDKVHNYGVVDSGEKTLLIREVQVATLGRLFSNGAGTFTVTVSLDTPSFASIHQVLHLTETILDDGEDKRTGKTNPDDFKTLLLGKSGNLVSLSSLFDTWFRDALNFSSGDNPKEILGILTDDSECKNVCKWLDWRVACDENEENEHQNPCVTIVCQVAAEDYESIHAIPPNETTDVVRDSWDLRFFSGDNFRVGINGSIYPKKQNARNEIEK